LQRPPSVRFSSLVALGHKESPHSPRQCPNVVTLLVGLASLRVALRILLAEALTQRRHPGAGVRFAEEMGHTGGRRAGLRHSHAVHEIVARAPPTVPSRPLQERVPSFRGRFLANVAGIRHSRESGNPVNTANHAVQALDARLRGHDGGDSLNGGAVFATPHQLRPDGKNLPL